MKKLLFLLLIWLGLTLQLSFQNKAYQEETSEQNDRRAFLVYSNSLSGCMAGAAYVDPKFKNEIIYPLCRNRAYTEKAIYLGKACHVDSCGG